MKRSIGLALAMTALYATLGNPPIHAVVAPPASLTFFKNYFLTGDYVVGGVGLWRAGEAGRASGDIVMSGVPGGADIVAAYLYVQTAEATQGSGIDGATFNGNDLGPGTASLAKALNWAQATQPCWYSPSGRRMVTYRADVLRFLPLGPDGKQAANGTHTIDVPDVGVSYSDDDESGTESADGVGPRAVGASLVVVYRTSTMPLRSIVLYDGGATAREYSTFAQVLTGFYEAGPMPEARMAIVVGDGRPTRSEVLRFNGQAVAVDPFGGTAGPKWDNPTFAGLPLAAGASSAVVEVQPTGENPDCLCLSAIVLSTAVQDSDGDGLLDAWERQTSANPASLLNDPFGKALPPLGDMGAKPDHKDLFLEVGYMFTSGATTYGGVEKPQHSHLPTREALEMMARAFRNAPVENPDGSSGIDVHFDVGAHYQPTLPPSVGTCASDATWTLDCAIVPEALASGGDAIDEMRTVCDGDGCQFSAYPGTVGWKTGFRFLRDEVLSGPIPLPGQEDPCDAPGSTCVRRFDPTRKDMFHYALFAHAVGLPKSDDPNSGEYFVPRTSTGVGDFPGGDLMVTLGAFDDGNGLPVGTSFMQASTLMHELGHNLERRHGGDAFEPNCKPVYLSVMNYLYQLRGLLDDAGKPNLDFARGTVAPLDETALMDGALTFASPYRIGWYAPKATSYLAGFGTAASKHCDGTPLEPTDQEMVRIDARSAASAIDWRADGTVDAVVLTQDINFNGRTSRPDSTPESLGGADDWSKILLNQVGSRRNAGGLFLDSQGRWMVGPMSLDAGRGDLGRGDLGRGDLGRGDLGRGDRGRGDLGRGDLGRGDLGTVMGRGDLGRGDLGGGDLFVGDPDNPGGELDFETATELAKTPPNEFSACVIGVDCSVEVTPLHRARLAWKMPTVGDVLFYEVFRVDGAELTPAAVAMKTKIGEVIAIPGEAEYSAVDDSELVNGAQYTYFTMATYADGTKSDPSNAVTITAVNAAPVAVPDNYAVDEDAVLSVPAPGVLANDSDPDGALNASAILVNPPAHGTLTLSLDGAFTYTPASNYVGVDTFTYRAEDSTGTGSEATVTIAVNGVNDPPVAAGQSVTVLEDTPASIALVADDADGQALTFEVVAGPSHGNLSPAPGGFLYTPAPNYSGPDAFTFRASDGTSWSNVAAVSITVVPVDDPPVPAPDSYSTNEDVVLNVAAPGVLENDAAGGDVALQAVLVSGPASGTLTLNANGSFCFVPAPNASGPVTFSYSVVAGSETVGPVTVTITIAPVNDAPIGTDKTLWTRRNTVYVLGASDFGFRDPLDSPANALLSVKVTTLPSRKVGTLMLSGVALAAGTFVTRTDLDAGKLVFVPKRDATGTSGFNFRVRDDGGTELGGVDVARFSRTLTTKVVSCRYSNDHHEMHDHR